MTYRDDWTDHGEPGDPAVFDEMAARNWTDAQGNRYANPFGDAAIAAGELDDDEDANRTEMKPCGCWRQYDRHAEQGPVATYTCRAHMEPDPKEQQ